MISLFAREERDAKRQSLNDPLTLLTRHIDFAAIAAAMDAQLTLGPSGRGARPPYPAAVRVKLLLLQPLYNLSDEKHGKSFYGYKLHANTDRRWGFIRRHEVTAANVHDSRHFETILDPVNTRRTIRADDSAYADRAREAELKRQGYRADIQHKGHATKPLSQAQQRRNHRIAQDRAFGEHPFARLTQQGGKCLRTIGLMRATVVIGLKVASHNLMRLARLQHRGIVPA